MDHRRVGAAVDGQRLQPGVVAKRQGGRLRNRERDAQPCRPGASQRALDREHRQWGEAADRHRGFGAAELVTRWIAHRVLGGPRRAAAADILTIAAAGGDAVLVTDDAALDWNPVWAPDGKSLYFASNRGGTMNLGASRSTKGPVGRSGSPSPSPCPPGSSVTSACRPTVMHCVLLLRARAERAAAHHGSRERDDLR